MLSWLSVAFSNGPCMSSSHFLHPLHAHRANKLVPKTRIPSTYWVSTVSPWTRGGVDEAWESKLADTYKMPVNGSKRISFMFCKAEVRRCFEQ